MSTKNKTKLLHLNRVQIYRFFEIKFGINILTKIISEFILIKFVGTNVRTHLICLRV